MRCGNFYLGSIVALLAFSLATSSAGEQTITLNTIDRGWYDRQGLHIPTNNNYLVGDNRIIVCNPTDSGCLDDYRNFFVFDLSSVTQPIGAATLRLWNPGQPWGFRSPELSETYELHDVTTPSFPLLQGTAGVNAHTDLGTGIVYGSRVITEADTGQFIEIVLNSSAIAAMNANGPPTGNNAPFVIGGSLITLDQLANGETVFGTTSDGEVTQLTLTLVPEPSTPFLLAVGAVRLLCRRRK
jgi:hypothetical protein